MYFFNVRTLRGKLFDIRFIKIEKCIEIEHDWIHSLLR